MWRPLPDAVELADRTPAGRDGHRIENFVVRKIGIAANEDPTDRPLASARTLYSILSTCTSHAATTATTPTTPALLLFKEHLGIKGFSTGRCCDADENRQRDYSQYGDLHGSISSYEGHCANAAQGGGGKRKPDRHRRRGIWAALKDQLALALDMKISAPLPICPQMFT